MFQLLLALGVSHTQTVWGVFFFVENFGDLFCSLCEHDIVGTLFCDADRFHIENKTTNQDHEQIESIDSAIATVE